ncbi:MAG: hypothetical protein HC774_00620 [Sphingomonadales bacterium]|nr:hypothetical protein [Sphingomonadales bacterium]
MYAAIMPPKKIGDEDDSGRYTPTANAKDGIPDISSVNAIMTPTPTTVVAIRYGFNRFTRNFSAPTSLGFDLSLARLQRLDFRVQALAIRTFLFLELRHDRQRL